MHLIISRCINARPHQSNNAKTSDHLHARATTRYKHEVLSDKPTGTHEHHKTTKNNKKTKTMKRVKTMHVPLLGSVAPEANISTSSVR
jgi:hypothetical protein